ncbi:AtpZ/AtpI family protein [Desulfitobacterium metallireducens]|uniref:ATPase n=1 Tax=Desulfitobacterium metallireducens DSM 15288 TaxID=871968 RepID=W0EGU5_9FIRM|nr:AtpZ/AtpI family protein [Desulfitobacterium metallireducens]AHF08276.1 ATPase [Desulfitobacterium metallireducens DSM 15288]
MGDNRLNVVKAMALGTSIATTLAILVGGGYLLGKYLDQRWETQPWFQLLFILVGLVFGGSYVVVSLRKLGMTDDKK